MSNEVACDKRTNRKVFSNIRLNMKKVFRKIRNMFFQKKHDELIFKIKNKQECLKVLQVELNKINHLAEHGILGDKLLDKQILLEQNVRTIKNDILLLKWRYQNKMWRREWKYDKDIPLAKKGDKVKVIVIKDD